MELKQIELEKTAAFSKLFLDYIQQKPELTLFYNQFPRLKNFRKQIEEKKQNFSQEKRNTLQQVLIEQYKNAKYVPQQAIDDLTNENTFLITTGHQLSLFTGPLYFVYKIITAINAAQELKKNFPKYNFYPLYWMHTEDHDFEEISHFLLFGKKYQWESQETGPVGWFSTKGLASIFEQIPEKPEIFERAYMESENLAKATFQLVNRFFKDYPLICLDPSAPALKASFSEVIWKDIEGQHSEKKVFEQSEKLENLGYKTLVHPREINFFYMEKGIRSRLIEENNFFLVKDTDLKFSKEELKKLLANSPQKFSPNVVIRPLYQEFILPNLAYVGGPSELAYWLQLKEVFNLYRTTFPILMPRNFALVINKINAKKLQKLNRRVEELFLEEHQLKDNFLYENAGSEISLEKPSKEIENIFEEIALNTQNVDASLEKWVKAEGQKVQKILNNIEKRLKKREEEKMETEIKQLLTLKNKLFPNNSLQERTENILNFWLNNPNFIQELQEKFNAFDFKMHILIENIAKT